jgi:hypothetical protein
MNTLDFLQRVLPSAGFYVSAVLNKGQPPMQGFFPTVDDLAKAVTASDQRKNNTYFAISSFIEKGSRKQENVRLTRVLSLDVDCGGTKPFPDWKAGLIALGNFVTQVGLPKPLIIHSGNGLHVYWVMTTDLAPEQWQPLADALKAATVAKIFKVDPATTANSALVLRPVGTHNPKGGNVVRLLLDASPVDVEEMASALSAYLVPVPVMPPIAPRPKVTSGLAQALQVTQEFPPANPTVIANKCQQVGWGVQNQGAVSEPFWYALIGVAAHCQDPEGTALSWSENHPTYDPNKTLRKLAQWKQVTTGPTTCKKFEDLRSEGCKGCKFKDKVGSPARLGVQYMEVAPATTAPSDIVNDIPVPRPFKRTTDGMKMTVDETDVDVCKFDIYPVSYGKDETLGYETVRFHWFRQHRGWQELVMRQALLTEGHRDFATVLADQGIILNNKNQTGYFQLMLRSYMDELRQKRAMTNLYASMGWKENFSQFVIGDTVLRRNADGTVSEELISLSSGSSRLGQELWDTAGSVEAWSNFTSLVQKADLRAHMFALAVGLSGPLYAFTGLKGLTVSLYGPTGGGKSLAQLWIQSIYGNPDKLHFAAKFTQNSLFGRMGLYAHMPMTIDEVTMMDNREVGDFAYWVSQGRDKARMNRNAEERDSKTWAMPVIVSTNKSMNSKLIASGLDTDAQLARILEVSVPPSKIFTKDSSAGRKVYEFISNNYGLVGREFIKRLLELGESGVRAAIAQATEDFHRTYKANFAGEERYWEQSIILADLAARMAHEWGLISFDPKLGIEWVLSQVGAIRRTASEFRVDAFDLLTEYLNENSDATLTVTQTGNNKPLADFSRIPRGELRVRFELHRKTNGDVFSAGTVMLDRTHFRRWLANRGADYKTFMGDLQTENILATPKSSKAYLGKDSPIKLGQSYVIGVNLNHPRLQGILSDADQAIEDLAYGQMKVV